MSPVTPQGVRKDRGQRVPWANKENRSGEEEMESSRGRGQRGRGKKRKKLEWLFKIRKVNTRRQKTTCPGLSA